MTSTSITRVALYVRVSTKRQADTGMSIEDQISRLSAHCREKGWLIAETYQDPGHTAKTLNRPALKRLLADAERTPKKFDVVLAIDNNRLSRVAADFLAIHTLLNKRSIDLRCLNLPDGVGAEAKFVATIIASVAELENMKRAQRVQEVMESNASNGYWNGGHPPYGYRTIEVAVDGKTRVRKQLEIDPKEADVVRRIFRMRLTGIDSRGCLGVRKIVKQLAKLEIVSRAGKPWSIQAVHDILRDTTYVGLHPYRLFHLDGAAEKNTELREVTFMPCPAILDSAIFDTVQALLDKADAKVKAARLTNGSLMLTGLLYCDSCGAMMHIVTGKGGRYRYYVCGERHRTAGEGCVAPKLPLPKVEEAVTEAILPFLLAPDRIPALAAAIQHALKATKGPLEAELRSRQAALNESNRRLRDILNRIVGARGATRKHLDQLLEQEQATHDRLQEETTALRGRVRERIPVIEPARYPALAALVARGLKEGSLAFRQGIARLLIERIGFDGSALRLCPRNIAMEEEAVPRAA
jgi:DNA invertase Pin-like site-specific DNA recombinase